MSLAYLVDCNSIVIPTRYFIDIRLDRGRLHGSNLLALIEQTLRVLDTYSIAVVLSAALLNRILLRGLSGSRDHMTLGQDS